MPGRRRVDDDAVKVDAVRVGPRQRHDLCERDKLIYARRHSIEDVGKVCEAEIGAATSVGTIGEAADQTLEFGDRLVHLDLDGV